MGDPAVPCFVLVGDTYVDPLRVAAVVAHEPKESLLVFVGGGSLLVPVRAADVVQELANARAKSTRATA